MTIPPITLYLSMLISPIRSKKMTSAGTGFLTMLFFVLVGTAWALTDGELKEMEDTDRHTIRRNDEVLSWMNRWIPTVCRRTVEA